MGVELASLITLGDVDLGQVADTGNLDIVRGLDEVRASDRAVGNETGPVAVLGAPGDFDTLGVADGAHLRRGPKAEVGGRAAQKGVGQYKKPP